MCIKANIPCVIWSKTRDAEKYVRKHYFLLWRMYHWVSRQGNHSMLCFFWIAALFDCSMCRSFELFYGIFYWYSFSLIASTEFMCHSLLCDVCVTLSLSFFSYLFHHFYRFTSSHHPEIVPIVFAGAIEPHEFNNTCHNIVAWIINFKAKHLLIPFDRAISSFFPFFCPHSAFSHFICASLAEFDCILIHLITFYCIQYQLFSDSLRIACRLWRISTVRAV